MSQKDDQQLKNIPSPQIFLVQKIYYFCEIKQSTSLHLISMSILKIQHTNKTLHILFSKYEYCPKSFGKVFRHMQCKHCILYAFTKDQLQSYEYRSSVYQMLVKKNISNCQNLHDLLRAFQNYPKIFPAESGTEGEAGIQYLFF